MQRTESPFLDVLVKVVGPALAAHGFELAEGTSTNRLTYCFVKRLDDTTEAKVRFERPTHGYLPEGWNFRIWLRRYRLPPEDTIPYDGLLDSPLDYVLRFVFKPANPQAIPHRWHANTLAEYELALRDAIKQLEAFGLPWLDDPRSRNPNFIEPRYIDQFRQTVIAIAAPELGKLGYEIQALVPPTWVVFSKTLNPAEFAHIQWQQIASFVGSGWQFVVCLNRSRAFDAFNMLNSNSVILLHQLLWHKFKLPDFDVPDFWWQYSSSQELEAKSREALGYLLRYGIPWIEDADSHL